MADKARTQAYYERWAEVFVVVMVGCWLPVLFGSNSLPVGLIALLVGIMLFCFGGVVWAIRRFRGLERKGGVVKWR